MSQTQAERRRWFSLDFHGRTFYSPLTKAERARLSVDHELMPCEAPAALVKRLAGLLATLAQPRGGG